MTMMGRVMLVRADKGYKSALYKIAEKVGLREIDDAIWRGRWAIGVKLMTFEQFEVVLPDFARIGAHIVWRPEGPAEPLDGKHEAEQCVAALAADLPTWTIAQLTEERRRITAGLETLGRLASQSDLMSMLMWDESNEQGSARIIGAANALAELDAAVSRELVARAKKVIAR